MRKLLLLAILSGLGWYAYSHYPEPFRALLAKVSGGVGQVADLQLPGVGAPRPTAEPLPEILKCTTADGRVIYGEVPANTRCQTVEKVAERLTVLPREEFVGSYGAGQVAPPRQSLPDLQALSQRVRTIGEGADAEPGFNCDGRTRCSQMTSCAEATDFLDHCPGTLMDGDGDGIPCEEQWCR